MFLHPLSYNLEPYQPLSQFVSFQGFNNMGYAFNRTFFDTLRRYQAVWNETDEDWDTAIVDGLFKLQGFNNYQVRSTPCWLTQDKPNCYSST